MCDGMWLQVCVCKYVCGHTCLATSKAWHTADQRGISKEAEANTCVYVASSYHTCLRRNVAFSTCVCDAMSLRVHMQYLCRFEYTHVEHNIYIFVYACIVYYVCVLSLELSACEGTMMMLQVMMLQLAQPSCSLCFMQVRLQVGQAWLQVGQASPKHSASDMNVGQSMRHAVYWT